MSRRKADHTAGSETEETLHSEGEVELYGFVHNVGMRPMIGKRKRKGGGGLIISSGNNKRFDMQRV